MDGTWTISELADRAAAALAASESAQVSGRVRDMPNERLIRWYTTIGLVDPPLGRRGRTALYGSRHLLQLVAVKRRQAMGRTIAEIQLELAAATDARLEQIAALPADAGVPEEPRHPVAADGSHVSESGPAGPLLPSAEPAQSSTINVNEAPDAARGQTPGTAEAGDLAGSSGGSSPDARGRARFWSVRPDVSYGRAAASVDYGTSPPGVVQGVRLTPGLTLLLDVPALSGDDVAAIQAAARPLLDELRRRGLVSPSPEPSRAEPSPTEAPPETPLPPQPSPEEPVPLPVDPPRRPQ
ncbi:MerR family transcriptional regulator [Actinomadura macra]|uniref:MerR family transcriptional regulator n=1 Tax=Actinomadura macra TaxID=46164 RepID=UPI000A70894D|nr:MerR family transcriptional regulator [Actinomadura macra]